MSQSLVGPKILEYSVGEWCPDQHGKAPPEAVALSIKVELWENSKSVDLVVRLKSRRAVDELVGLLEQYRDLVWPKGGKHGVKKTT